MSIMPKRCQLGKPTPLPTGQARNSDGNFTNNMRWYAFEIRTWYMKKANCSNANKYSEHCFFQLSHMLMVADSVEGKQMRRIQMQEREEFVKLFQLNH